MNFQRVLTGIFIVLTALFAVAEEPSPREGVRISSITMKMKLEMSKRLIAGLTEEDFTLLTDSAKAIQTLHKLEAFTKNASPDYQTQRKVFSFSTSELLRNAEEKNLDGATLAFAQMTMSCVKCHQVIRKH